MLATKRSAVVSLRNPLHAGVEAGQISPEVQNRGISGPTKRTNVPQTLLNNNNNLFRKLHFIGNKFGMDVKFFCDIYIHNEPQVLVHFEQCCILSVKIHQRVIPMVSGLHSPQLNFCILRLNGTFVSKQ